MLKSIDISIVSILAVFSLANSSFAQSSSAIDSLSPDQTSRMMTNVADDFAMCSAFYQIVSECLNNTKAESGSKYEEISLMAIQQSATFLSYSSLMTLQLAGRDYDVESIGTKSMQTVTGWYNLKKQEMVDEIQTCQNLSLLYTKHLELCNTYIQDSNVLMEKWAGKIVSE